MCPSVTRLKLIRVLIIYCQAFLWILKEFPETCNDRGEKIIIVGISACIYVWVRACVRARERERERMCVWERENERERMCLCVRARVHVMYACDGNIPCTLSMSAVVLVWMCVKWSESMHTCVSLFLFSFRLCLSLAVPFCLWYRSSFTSVIYIFHF